MPWPDPFVPKEGAICQALESNCLEPAILLSLTACGQDPQGLISASKNRHPDTLSTAPSCPSGQALDSVSSPRGALPGNRKWASATAIWCPLSRSSGMSPSHLELGTAIWNSVPPPSPIVLLLFQGLLTQQMISERNVAVPLHHASPDPRPPPRPSVGPSLPCIPTTPGQATVSHRHHCSGLPAHPSAQSPLWSVLKATGGAFQSARQLGIPSEGLTLASVPDLSAPPSPTASQLLPSAPHCRQGDLRPVPPASSLCTCWPKGPPPPTLCWHSILILQT